MSYRYFQLQSKIAVKPCIFYQKSENCAQTKSKKLSSNKFNSSFCSFTNLANIQQRHIGHI